MNRSAVFLDRDGVLNRALVRNGKPYAPRILSQFRLLPGAAAAVRDLKAAGFLVIVVTNQPDIGNGLVDPGTVEEMHSRLRAKLPLDDIKVCEHRQNEGCACRKPAPGMLLDAASDWDIVLADSFMVGDRIGDVVAGRRAGCTTVFVDRGYAEGRGTGWDIRVRNLPAAVAEILKRVPRQQQ